MSTDSQRVTADGDAPKISSLMIVCLGMLLAAVAVIFLPVVRFVIGQDVDYGYHYEFIVHVLSGQSLASFLVTVPHFLYHLLVILVSWLLPGIDILTATILVSLGCYGLLAVILFMCWYRWLGRPQRYITGFFYGVLTLALMMIMPMNIFTPNNLYLGYIATSLYFNPTYVVLKPLAVLVFMAIVGAFEGYRPEDHTIRTGDNQPMRRGLQIIGCAVITLLCVLAKPSYIICLLPALILVSAYRFVRRQHSDWLLIVNGVLLPAGLILFFQAILFGTTHSIVFAPLAAMQSVVRINPAGSQGLVLKFGLAILFPLLVYLLYYKKAVRDPSLNLAWLTFGFGAAYMYLLGEGGSRLEHTNFFWSGHISLFIVFVISAVFFLREYRSWRWWPPQVICLGAFGLHLISGLNWYYIHVTTLGMHDVISGWW
jgi:hypothetical protein